MADQQTKEVYDAAELCTTLAEPGAACPGCGYGLAGIEIGECPECGTKFTAGDIRSSADVPALERICAVGAVLAVVPCGLFAASMIAAMRGNLWSLEALTLLLPAAAGAVVAAVWLRLRWRRRNDPLGRAERALRHMIVMWVAAAIMWFLFAMVALR